MTQHTRTRRLAVLAAGALATTSLAAIGVAATTTTASAATATPATFTWAFSEYIKRPIAMGGQFAAPVVSDGATVDSATGKVTFVGGTGRTDTKTHVTSVTYEGTAAFSDSHGGTFYTVTFADPTVTVDADGNGALSADIAWVADGVTPGSAQDVPLTSFTAAETTWANPFAFTAAPDWTGEVAPGTYATDEPKEGKSWAQAFVTTLPSSVRKFFYSSVGTSDSSNAAKAPAPFDAVIPGPKVAASVTSQSPAGVSISVAGSGFTAVTNPGDAGVYVGLAPSGGLPDVSTQASMSGFAVADYALPSRIVNGSFTSTLNATVASLDRTKSYSVYTWQAHSHSNTTQDTETPVTIDWSKLTAPPAPPAPPVVTVTKATTTATAKVTKKPTTAKAGSLTVTLKSSGGKPTGKVTVKLTSKGKKAVTKTAKAKNGKAVVKLPKLKAGSWKATVAYAGSDDFTSAKKVVTFKVKKSKKK